MKINDFDRIKWFLCERLRPRPTLLTLHPSSHDKWTKWAKSQKIERLSRPIESPRTESQKTGQTFHQVPSNHLQSESCYSARNSWIRWTSAAWQFWSCNATANSVNSLLFFKWNMKNVQTPLRLAKCGPRYVHLFNSPQWLPVDLLQYVYINTFIIFSFSWSA